MYGSIRRPFDYLIDRLKDKSLGIETCGDKKLWELDIREGNVAEALHYSPTPYPMLQKIFKQWGGLLYGRPFIDFGCGKGRALVIAANYGPSKIIGVDFAGDLTRIAQKNLEKKGVAASVITTDFMSYNLPRENCVFFLYNPTKSKATRELARDFKNRPFKDSIILVNPLRSHLYQFEGLKVTDEINGHRQSYSAHLLEN